MAGTGKLVVKSGVLAMSGEQIYDYVILWQHLYRTCSLLSSRKRGRSSAATGHGPPNGE